MIDISCVRVMPLVFLNGIRKNDSLRDRDRERDRDKKRKRYLERQRDPRFLLS